MKFREVKKRFQEDFNNNFYNFDGVDVYNRIIMNRNFYIPSTNTVNFRPKKFTLAIKILSLIFVVFLLYFSKYIVPSSKGSDLENYFKDVDNASEVLVCSSYRGEELRIYKGISKYSSNNDLQFFYYFIEVRDSGTEYISFRNLNTTEYIEIFIVPMYGNISELISTNQNDIIEVTICYKNGHKLIQYFTCIKS